MTFTVKTAKGTAADPSVFTEATESNAVHYRLRNLMNQPSQCIVTLNDPNFAAWQKYSAKGADTYFGLYSRCKITDTEIAPTTVFNGPVVRVVSNPRSATVELHCRDWLHQLDTQEIIFDTREDLDGNGLRESECYRMDTAGPYMHGIVLSGADHRLYDTIAGWSENDWTGSTHYLSFSSKMGSTGSFWQACSTVSDAGYNFLNGTDQSDSWFSDAAYMEAEKNIDAEDLLFEMYALTYIDETKVTQVDLEVVYSYENADFFDLEIQHGGSIKVIYNKTSDHPASLTDYKVLKFTDLAGLVGDTNANLITDHKLGVHFDLDHDGVHGNDRVTLRVKFIRWTIHYEGCTVNTTAYTIDDDGDDYLVVSENLITAAIDKHAPYSISRELTYYVKDLVGTYDTVTALDTTTDLVASTTVLTRHYHYMRGIPILQDLAAADGTEFWLDEDLHLHWNDPYTTNGTTVNDSDVLYWLNPTIGTDQGYANRVTVIGQRTSTSQISSTKDNAVVGTPNDPLEYYGIHSKAEQNPGIYTQTDADSYAQALVDRLDDPAVHVSYAVNGSGAGAKGWRDIGDVVKINSTQLGLSNEWYVVVETRFDSTTGLQEVYLAPRATDGLFKQQMIFDGTRWTQDRIANTRQYMDYRALHTETW